MESELQWRTKVQDTVSLATLEDAHNSGGTNSEQNGNEIGAWKRKGKPSNLQPCINSGQAEGIRWVQGEAHCHSPEVQKQVTM